MSTPELPAGRELDALVAETVMGFATSRWWASVGIDIAEIAPSDISVRTLPAYSTDIAAAWLVVEKMEAMGWKVTYRTTGPRPGLRRVEVEVPAPGLKGPAALYAENAETAPLAICRAALAARLPHQEDT